MNFKLKLVFFITTATLLLLQIPTFADNAEAELSRVNPIDRKTEFINNHQIAFSQIKVNNEIKKFLAVIPSMGAKSIMMYEINSKTNELIESATFKENLHSPFYITFDPSGMYFYGVSGTRNFVTQYIFDPASKKFVTNKANPKSTTNNDMQTACSDNPIYNFDYFRTLQFFPSENKAYITCEDLRGEFYVLGYQFDSKNGLITNSDSSLWKENKQNTDRIVEKSMIELANPLAVLIDPSGHYLFSIDANNKLRQFKLNQNDQFQLTGSGHVTDISKAVSMTFDPSGKNIYIVARDGVGGSIIEQYKFDPISGMLDKSDEVILHNKPGSKKTDPKVQATHIQFAPSGHYAYVLDNRSNLIYQFRVDPGTGNLTALNPSTFATCFIIRSLVFDPDPNSHFAYAAASMRSNIKPQNEKLCKPLTRDPFDRYVDRLVIDPVTGQLTNFVPKP
jgi:6-phosphogluconolactonase (cycloisomerase 2 family)